jgi:DNA-binding CsgD family transcriptional regulator
MVLYNQGLTDNEIAKIQGVTPMAIYFWRKNKKLKSNFIKKGGCNEY